MVKYYLKVCLQIVGPRWNDFLAVIQDCLDNLKYHQRQGIFPVKPNGSPYSYAQICDFHEKLVEEMKQKGHSF